MKCLFLSLFVVLTTSFSCEKTAEDKVLEDTGQNAQIIGFNPDKCYCCWGWEIKDKIDENTN
jgi:hypothetical protein